MAWMASWMHGVLISGFANFSQHVTAIWMSLHVVQWLTVSVRKQCVAVYECFRLLVILVVTGDFCSFYWIETLIQCLITAHSKPLTACGRISVSLVWRDYSTKRAANQQPSTSSNQQHALIVLVPGVCLRFICLLCLWCSACLLTLVTPFWRFFPLHYLFLSRDSQTRRRQLLQTKMSCLSCWHSQNSKWTMPVKH